MNYLIFFFYFWRFNR